MLTKPVGFPSLGEITKYLFDRSGLLSTSTTANKSLQTKLNRLAKEKSQLQKNLQQAIDSLRSYLEDVSPNERLAIAITATLHDCFSQYLDMVKGEGCYLSKSLTIRWALKTRFIDRICLSQQKYTYMLNMVGNDQKLPTEEFWFLPDISDGGVITWPMAKVLNWAYTITDTNRTSFHYPDKSAQSNTDYRLQQNHDNAYRWSNGETCRSWLTLKKNLEQSFDAMGNATNTKNQRKIGQETRSGILFSSFIARLSTEVCKDIEREYGVEFLVSCINQYRVRTLELSLENTRIENTANKLIISKNITEEKEIDAVWFRCTERYWKLKTDQIIEFSHIFSGYTEALYKKAGKVVSIPQKKRSEWVNNFGPYYINSILHEVDTNVIMTPSNDFIKSVDRATELRKNNSTTLTMIDQLRSNVETSDYYAALKWQLSWITACYYYRNQEYSDAHIHYTEAFEQGKYVAGSQQYPLVNQYVESCAKNNEWVAFKKGVAWATYIGLEIRWIRDNHESDETLKFAFKLLKQTTYPVL